MKKITLNQITLIRDNWSLVAEGIFKEGIHLVTGEVGCGKSSLALLISGFLVPVAGNVCSTGIVTRMLSFQFPEYHVTGLTLADECRSWGLEADTILQSTGLSGRSSMPPLSLSRGELKRLHLACVMAKNYDLLVLDEPFSSLDSREKYQFCKNLEEQKTGICIIFTHEHTILPRVNHIWEIVDGVLYNRGSPPEAILHWYTAPPIIKQLIMEGKVPKNVSLTDLKEVSCRTHG